MPAISVQIWPGRSDEVKEKLIKRLTDVTVEVMNVPPEAVSVTINEVEKTNWGVGGVPFSKTRPD